MMRHVLCILAFLTFFAVPAYASSISIVIDISSQQMQVSVNGTPTHTFDVSTGRKGYSTPKGRYGVVRMHRKYYSKKYDNAPMPYSIFFYGGYAIHGTTEIRRLGNVASHGCVRLHPDNARMLFELVKQMGSGNTSIRVRS